MNVSKRERNVAERRPGIESITGRAAVTAKDAPGAARGYHTPELHVVGQAADLVQGGGGNYADNNRARQY
jgi:hypothetical protein